MPATAGTTTIEVPLPLRERLAQHRVHPRQAYHEVIAEAMDLYERRQRGRVDPLIQRHRQALRRAARRNRIGRIWLWGARARGEARPDDDVRLLIQTLPGATLFDLGGFQTDAADILGVKVVVTDVEGIPSPSKERLLPEAVMV